MTPLAKLYAQLRPGALIEFALSLPGRVLLVCARDRELATAACRALTLRQPPLQQAQGQVDDVCVVEHYSRAGFRIDKLGNLPSRSYQDPTMGLFHIFELEDGWAVMQPGRSSLFCAASGEMVWLIPDDLLAAEPERGGKLTDTSLIVMAECLRRGGYFLAHAGAIGREGRCVLLAGESGAGKTTLTLRKVLEGWDFYGDDMIIVGRDDQGLWRVHPYWRAIHLTPRTLEMLGALRVESTVFTVDNKMKCDITELAPVRPPAPGLVESILCLRASWRPEKPEPLSPADAMAALGAAFLSGIDLRKTGTDLENLLDLLANTSVYAAGWSMDSEAIESLLTANPKIPC